MKVQELFEWSEIPGEIFKSLRAKNYKYLKAGVDQAAFLDPNGNFVVFKVFGTASREYKVLKNGFSEDQLMFKFWYEYCQKNSDNEFLPKFYGYESFEFEGKKYLQIRMEQLQHLPEDLGNLLERFSDMAETSYSKSAMKDVLRSVGHTDAEEITRTLGWFRFYNDNELEELNKLILLIGEDGFAKLWKTLEDLGRIGKKNGWTYDLHGMNFMHRRDGIPVIVDPWVL